MIFKLQLFSILLTQPAKRSGIKKPVINISAVATGHAVPNFPTNISTTFWIGSDNMYIGNVYLPIRCTPPLNF